jgi:hypothetical protein
MHVTDYQLFKITNLTIQLLVNVTVYSLLYRHLKIEKWLVLERIILPKPKNRLLNGE